MSILYCVAEKECPKHPESSRSFWYLTRKREHKPEDMHRITNSVASKAKVLATGTLARYSSGTQQHQHSASGPVSSQTQWIPLTWWSCIVQPSSQSNVEAEYRVPSTLSHQKSIAINYMAIKLSGNFQVAKNLSIVGNFSVLLTSLRTFSGSSLLMCRLPSNPQYFKLSNRDCFQPSNAWRPSTCRSPFTRNLEDFNEKYKYHATFPNRAAGNLRDCDRLYRVQGRHLNTRRTSSKFSVPRSGIDRSCHQRNNQCNLQRTSRF